ncbi:hypothetical protein [Cognaticolwellia aestuarii]|uniref:hypothetical protein n=1 Tax=Cognaticolwellia aestuarii TaxID=329993 RepID=UPI0009876204|nr:hypothetical protein [Cognaticolwellia aestuarii]
MIFVLAIIAMFVAVSIYFFFKAENLQREIILMKRDISATKKENKAYVDMMAIIAQRNEEIVKQRFIALRSASDDKTEMHDIIAPMINNYATIFNDSVRAKGKLQTSIKKVYEGHQKGTYKVLSNYINQSNKEIKRAWSSNNINGFIMLVEALLLAK